MPVVGHHPYLGRRQLRDLRVDQRFHLQREQRLDDVGRKRGDLRGHQVLEIGRSIALTCVAVNALTCAVLSAAMSVVSRSTIAVVERRETY